MLVDTVSRIYFKISDYSSLDELFADVGKQMQILVQNKNSIVFYQIQDIKDLLVLEYCPVGLDEYGEETRIPTWLNADELIEVQTNRISDKLDEFDNARENLETVKESIEDVLLNNDKKDDSGGHKA